MANTAGTQPQVINELVNAALIKAQTKPGPLAVWDVLRQLAQGNLTVLVTVDPNAGSAFDPTNLPGAIQPAQSLLSIKSDRGLLLAAFTMRNVGSLVPPVAPQNLAEEVRSAIEIAGVARQEAYAGLLLDPGTEHSMVIPSATITAGLDGANLAAKALLSNPNLAKNPGDTQARNNLVRAIAGGPMYTPIDRAEFMASKQVKFPLMPLGLASADPDQQIAPDAPSAVIFGTSQAEIAAAFDPEKWAPMPVRINDVVKTLQKTANLQRVIINPLGPALQLPIMNDTSGAAPAAQTDDILAEPTPEPGPATEPDGGTREGED